MIGYSDAGLAARALFYRAYFDVIVVVEDRGKEDFYREILKRLLGTSSERYGVLGIGGKDQVLRRLASRSERTQAWAEFYLVDGDFDELVGIAVPEDPFLVRLGRYDIESYLIEEEAVCEVLKEEMPRLSMDEIRARLDFGNWVTSVVEVAFPLAACAATLEKNGKTQDSIQVIETFVCGSKSVPDVDRIRIRIAEEITDDKGLETLEEIRRRVGESVEEHIRWISGKHMWIPLLCRLLRGISGRNFRKESLSFRLAKRCEFRGLEKVRVRLLDLTV